MVRKRRCLVVAVLVGTVMGCSVETTQPQADAPVGATKLTGGSSETVELFEDRLQHARYDPDVGAFGVIRQCQANPVEDADGNDWTTEKRGGSTYSKMSERGVVLVREVTLGPADFGPAGNLMVPLYESDRWAVRAVGTGQITISIWRDAAGLPLALNSNVKAQVAPIGPDDGWIAILDEPGDVAYPGAHDLMNEAFVPGGTALALFEDAVAEAKVEGTAGRLACDAHVWYTAGAPSWIQRNDVDLRF
jgi:hypothetical protein